MNVQDKNVEATATYSRLSAVRDTEPAGSPQYETAKPVALVEKQPDEETEQQLVLDREQVEEMIREVEDHLEQKGVALTFKVTEEDDRIQVEVRDADSKKVIRKIPEDDLIKLSQSMKDLAGTIMDKGV